MNVFCRAWLLAVVLSVGQIASAENKPSSRLASQSVTQQKKVVEVSGTVTDHLGPIIGASVLVKGANTGVITNLDGEFTMKIPVGATLIVSYIGYENKEIYYKGEKKLNILLDENIQQLEEVQVIAYGTTKKVTVTGAMSSINSDDILKSPVGNIANALTGKVTGLSSVQSSGQPGSDAPSIYVRGVGSLSTDLSQPLMLVDGVERSFFQLDPNEIEDITILKDASATAVFGVRGANGVIIVTTKRGKEGPARVSFTTSFAAQMPTRLPKFANSYDYATTYVAAQRHDGVPEGSLSFSDDMIEAFRTNSNPLAYPSSDWVDMTIKNAAMQTQHNFNISGGSKSVRYFASLGVFTQDGLFKSYEKDYSSNFSYNRYNYRINMDIDVTKTTLVKINLGGRLDDQNTPNYNNGTYTDLKYLFRDIYSAPPFGGAGIVDDKRIMVDSRTFAKIGTVADGLGPYYGRGYNDISGNTLTFDFQLEQKLDVVTKGLRLHLKGAYNSGVSQQKRREGNEARYEAILDDDGVVNLKKMAEKSTLSYNESFSKSRDWYMEAALNYKRDFGMHHVSGLAMYNQSMKYYPEGSWPGIPRSYIGIVGRATYDYKTRYMVDASVGYNGSENFAPGKRFGLFPAGSIGWLLSEERFMQSVKPYINYLKFRASYGVVGNDRTSDKSRFLYLPDSYNISSGGINFGTNNSIKIPGSSEAKKGNPDVTWETAAKQNYGIDIHFFDSKLKATFDYFVEHRKDILKTRTVDPGYLAVTLPTANIGKVDNKGYEISLKWEDNIKDVRYYIGVNLSYAKNKIVYMDEIKYPYDYMQATGKPVGQKFGYKYDGFFSKEDIANYEAERGKGIPDHGSSFVPKAGDVKYKDLNGDHKIDDKDRSDIGYPIYPLLSAGLNMGFSYKGFDFSMTWAGSAKTSRLLSGFYRMPFGDTDNNSLIAYMIDDAWTPEKGNASKAPAISFSSKINNYQDSDLWLRDASYLRLKNVEVGYSFSKKVLKKALIKDLRIFASGFNLLTFDKLKVSDPEADPTSAGEYPLIRVINVGLKLGF